MSILRVSQVWVALLTSSASTVISNVTVNREVNFPSSSLLMSSSSLLRQESTKIDKRKKKLQELLLRQAHTIRPYGNVASCTFSVIRT